MTPPADGRGEPAANAGWARRLLRPIVEQLRQGVTPHEVALAVALGITLGVFPILGATTILCGAAAYRLRLNQPVIQLVNYLAYPLQLLALIPFYRAGETLLGKPHLPLSVPLLIDRFGSDTGRFFADYGMIALQGILAWLIVAPMIAAVAYFAVRPAARVAAARMRDRRRAAS